jgi:hypothetical protein
MKTLQSKSKGSWIALSILSLLLLIVAAQRAAAQTNTFPSSGNVGIGTTAPADPLTINQTGNSVNRILSLANDSSGSSAQSTLSFFEGATEKFKFGMNSSGATGYVGGGNAFQLWHFQNAPIVFGTNSIERMRVDGAGNVGIGTATPGVGGITSSTYLTLAATGSNRPAFEFVSNLSDGVGKEAGFLDWVFNTNSAGHKRIGNLSVDTEGTTANQRGGVMRFFTKPNGSATMPERMRIDSTGNVGIGTTSPSYLLDVSGSARINASGQTSIIGSTAAHWNGFKSNAPTGVWGFQQSERAFLGVGGNLYNRGFSANAISLFNGNTTAEDVILYNKNSTDAGFLVLKDSGNVGVGVVAPTYKLEVNGEINATGIRINGTPISGGGSSQWTTSGSNIYYNSGNVGIGTTNPLAKLELSSNSAIKLGNAYFSSGGDYVHLANNEWYNGTSWIADAPGALIQITGQDVNFYRHAAGSHTQSMTIKSSGNVGIGTTSPIYSLDVNGGVNGFRAKAATTSSSDAIATFENSSGVQAIVRGNGYIGIGTTAPGVKLDVNGYIAAGSLNGFVFTDDLNTGLTSSAPDKLNLVTGGTTRLHVDNAGNVGIGKMDPQYKLDVVGDIKASGTIHAKYQDLAEWVPSSEQLSAGTVVVLDQTRSNQVVSSSTAYDTRVAGVISAQPGITLGEGGEGKVLVATTGRVRMKVDASRGAIQIGDLLVTSDVLGVAMKSEPVEFAGRKMHMPGTIIGKALEPMAKGSGEILVLLSLQ